jgi:hypothetical protein
MIWEEHQKVYRIYQQKKMTLSARMNFCSIKPNIIPFVTEFCSPLHPPPPACIYPTRLLAKPRANPFITPLSLRGAGGDEEPF